MSLAPVLTVVVATRNRSDSLERVLKGVRDQVNPPTLEVVVGDNGSTDDTPRMVERMGAALPIRYVRVEQPGKGRTLNAAMRVSRGSLLVFTDDDVVPAPDWLAELSAAAERHPDSTVLGGTIEVDLAKVPAWVRRSPWLMGLLVSEHRGEFEETYGYAKYPFGPNMALRRAALAGLDAPYPEDLGPGTALPVGDERAFLLKISPPEALDRLFVPAARVSHEVRADYFVLRKALSRCFHAGRAHGWLGIRLVPPKKGGERGSLWELILSRLKGCGSVREFLCLSMRQLGFLWGSRERKRRGSPS